MASLNCATLVFCLAMISVSKAAQLGHRSLVNNREVVTFSMGSDNTPDQTKVTFNGDTACRMITALRVEYFDMDGIKHLRCVGFTYGDQENSCPAEGSNSAHQVVDFNLERDEYINFVSGEFYYNIESIYFKTNKQRAIGPFGMGKDPSKYPMQFSNNGAPLLFASGVRGVWLYSLQLSFYYTGVLDLEEKANTVAHKTYQAIKTDIKEILQVQTDYHCMLPDIAAKGCHYLVNDQENIDAQVACEFETLLDEVNLLATTSSALQNHTPRNLLTLKDYDSSKYLDEVAESKNFHNLITEIKFGLNTVIDVTEQQSAELSAYLKATASFDKEMAEKDLASTQGDIQSLREDSGVTTEVVSQRLSNILGVGISAAVGNIIEVAFKLGSIMLNNCNPFKLIFSGLDIKEMMDTMAELTAAIGDMMKLSSLANSLDDFMQHAEEISIGFRENQVAVDAMANIVEQLGYQTDVAKIQQIAANFIESYGDYSPQVSNQQVVYMGTLLDVVASDACSLMSGLSGIAADLFDSIHAVATQDCILVIADIAMLTSQFEDVYTLQFEMMNTLRSIVRGHISVAMAGQLGATQTTLDIRMAAITTAVVEAKYQAASIARCDILEYLAAGVRPDICMNLLFNEDQIQKLISYTGSPGTSVRTFFAYLPTQPQSDNSIPHINITQLLRGGYQSLQLPIANKEWLKEFGWVPASFTPETAFYIYFMEMYIPGLMCNQTGQPVHTVMIDMMSSNPSPLYAETAPPSYTVDKTVLKFEYTEPTQHCAGKEMTFPIRDHQSPEIKAEQDVCVISHGSVSPSPKDDFTYPSLFTLCTVKLSESASCTLVEDPTALNFQPMITVRLMIKEVFVKPGEPGIDECWPEGSRCPAHERCQNQLLDYCCQNSQGVCQRPFTSPFENE